jgi:hypothetical protein
MIEECSDFSLEWRFRSERHASFLVAGGGDVDEVLMTYVVDSFSSLVAAGVNAAIGGSNGYVLPGGEQRDSRVA